MSGGFSISHEKVHLLEDALNAAYEVLHRDKEIKEKEIFVDRRLSLNEVNWNTFNTIEKLSPFGVDNPRPVFLLENIKIDEMKLFGKEKNHLELKFKNDLGKKIAAIGFFMTDEAFEKPLFQGGVINLVASMEKSMFKSFPELRLRIVDII